METKKQKIKVAESAAKIEVIEVLDEVVQEIVVSIPSQEFRVLKSFTVDKIYNVGDVVSLSDEGVIKELKINKYIK
jgi:hypothetical protein